MAEPLPGLLQSPDQAGLGMEVQDSTGLVNGHKITGHLSRTKKSIDNRGKSRFSHHPPQQAEQ